MALSSRLLKIDLTLPCKYCGHSMIKKGGWFLAVHRFKCEGCKREVPITYSDKVALFNKHAHLSWPKPSSSHCLRRGSKPS
jgi:transposase-like protein